MIQGKYIKTGIMDTTLKSHHIKGIIFIFLMLQSAYVLPFFKSDSWGITQEEVIKKYLSPEEKYTEFLVSEKPEYNNKILSYIVAIDSDLKSKIKILQTSKKPAKDYLFVKNRLYSILVDYGIIANDKENKILEEIKKEFGDPSIQKDKQISIYSFKDNKTKVLVLSWPRPGGRECKVYYYANALFKMLITE